MATRANGPVSRKPKWIVGVHGPIIGSIYWRPWGRTSVLRWHRRDGRTKVKGTAAQDEWREIVAKRPVAENLPKLAQIGADYGSWEKLCPELATWLCDATYSDGNVKGEVTLNFRRRGSAIEATLKTEDGGLCMRCSGDTPDDALVAMELLLTADRPPWEIDPYPLGGRGKKKK